MRLLALSDLGRQVESVFVDDGFLNITGVGTTQKAGNFVFLRSSRYCFSHYLPTSFSPFFLFFIFFLLLSFLIHLHLFFFLISLLILLYFFSPRSPVFTFSLFSSYSVHAFDILTGPVIMHSGTKTCVVPFSALRPFAYLVKILYHIPDCLIIYFLSFAVLSGSVYNCGRTHGYGLIPLPFSTAEVI